MSPEDVAALAFQPPLHWSSPKQGDITLKTTTRTSETGLTQTSSVSLEIPVKIVGVADKPSARSIDIRGTEDKPYDLGAAVLASGPLSDILVDQDGSETFYLYLQGLSNGATPTSSSGEINYLGSNRYQIDTEAIKTLVLPPVKHYSGDKPYPSLRIRATSQEMDGNQVNSDWWTVNFAIEPVVDGYGGWTSRARADEGTLETNDQATISFASVRNLRLSDLDGSETVLRYKFDFSQMIDDAGIKTHLANNLDIFTLEELVRSYMVGEFEFDAATGVVTVEKDDIGGFALKPQLFLDSNQDFSIPGEIFIRDRATIDGGFVDRIASDLGTFYVRLIGTADVPKASSSSTAGSPQDHIRLEMGGETTDTDEALGRTVSESLYFVLKYLNPVPRFESRWTLTDGAGEVVGANMGDMTWILNEDDLADIRLYAPNIGADNHTMEFELTCIAVENDYGSTATDKSRFDVDMGQRSQGGNKEVVRPLPPILEILDHKADEDKVVVLKVKATVDPDDTSDPKVSLVISNIPAGAQLYGATLNPVTRKYLATMEDIEAGNVRIRPPRDFSGRTEVTVEAVATNRQAFASTSGEQALPLIFDPVVDGVGIAFSAVKTDNKVRSSMTV